LQSPFWLLARLSGLGSGIQAGRYRLEPGTTPYSLLEKMVRGDTVKVAVTLVEGWRFEQWRMALATESGLRKDSAGMSEADIMAWLGAPGVAAEGRFLPDTYLVSYGTLGQGGPAHGLPRHAGRAAGGLGRARRRRPGAHPGRGAGAGLHRREGDRRRPTSVR
jgi:hypothetical protein